MMSNHLKYIDVKSGYNYFGKTFGLARKHNIRLNMHYLENGIIFGKPVCAKNAALGWGN